MARPSPSLTARRWVGIGWVLAGLWIAPTYAGPEADAAQARLVQDMLPQLSARTTRAQTQAKAAEALFSGTASLATAFPNLSTAPLYSLGFVQSAKLTLEDSLARRAADRIAAPPAHLSPAQATRWRTAHQRALDAEAQADAAQGRVLAAVAAGLARAPALTESATAAMEARWRDLRTVAADAPPEDSALANAAGQATGELARLRTAALRRMIVPGDPTLRHLLDADLAQPLPTAQAWTTAESFGVEARMEWMSRAAPLTDDPSAIDHAVATLRIALVAQSLPALRAALSAEEEATTHATTEVASDTIDELRRQESEAQVALDAATAALSAAGIDPMGTDGGPIAESQRLKLRLAGLRLTTAEARIERRTRLAASGLALDTRATDADIANARDIADAAKKRAEDAAAGERTAAQLQKMIADLRVEIAALLEAEGARHDEAVHRYEELRREVDERAQGMAVSLALSPLAKNRDDRIDGEYRYLSGTIGRIRSERVQLSQTLRESNAHAAAGDRGDGDSPESEELSLAMADRVHTTESIAQNIEGEIDRVLALLSEAKSLSKRLRGRTSLGLRRTEGVLPEVVRELKELPALAQSRMRTHARQLQRLPTRLTEVGALGGWLWMGLKLIVLLFAWAVVRRRSDNWIAAGLAVTDPAGQQRLRPWERARVYPSWIVSGDLKALGTPLAEVTRVGADVALAGCLLAFLTPRLPAAGAVVYIGLAIGLVRLIPGLVGLAIITPSHTRPALRVTSGLVRDMILWTVRILVLWLAIESGLIYLAEEVLDAHRLADFIGTAGTIVLVLVGLMAINRWAPAIRTRLQDEGGTVEKWATASGAGPLSTTLRAATGSAILLARWGMHLGGRIIDRRAGLSWIGAALARRQLKEDEGDDAPPVDVALRDAVAKAAPNRLSGTDTHKRIVSVFNEWTKERQRGMVALIGDRGMGKLRLVDELVPVLGAEMDLIELDLARRITDSAEALTWLAQATGIGRVDLSADTASVSVLADRVATPLRARAPTVFVMRNTHLLFLRSVGRFEALRAVLAVMQGCSGQHFWLCTFHGPSWTFLDGIGEVVNLAGFRERVVIDPMAPAALSSWLEGATRSSGAEPMYDRLLHREAQGAERARLVDRAARAYWRLLAESSQGNPAVALSYWLTGLRKTPEDSVVEVGLFQAPEPLDIDDLDDADLFALTALIIHDGASLDELHESLNLTAGAVRSACRSLEDRAVIQADDTGEFFRVTKDWLPAVERLLQRRSFLHRR